MFYSDLAEGKSIEKEVAGLFEKMGCTVEQSEGLFPDYDLKVIDVDDEMTVEVKYDKQAYKTGNTTVEVGKIINGIEEKSGLSTSKADVYVLHNLNIDGFYVISTNKLRRLIEKGAYKKMITGGDGNRSKLALFDLKTLLKECEEIN